MIQNPIRTEYHEKTFREQCLEQPDAALDELLRDRILFDCPYCGRATDFYWKGGQDVFEKESKDQKIYVTIAHVNKRGERCPAVKIDWEGIHYGD